MSGARSAGSERVRVTPRSRVESILIVGGLVLALTFVAIAQGGISRAAEGYKQGIDLALGIAPQIALGFALAGLVTIVVPQELIGRWIGEGSGIQGVLIATVAGMLTPGGPFLQFPLVASLAKSGAAVGPLAAYLTAWSLLGLNRAIVWEIPLLGGTFAAARYVVTIAVPILVGLAMPYVYRSLSR
jgi:uncharacterized membrane protein YraQ (UPF0718 family)